MIPGLKELLEKIAPTGVFELSGLLEGLCGSAEARLLEHQVLRSHAHLSGVYRLRFTAGNQVRSLIVKRLKAENSQRSELAAKRWLPAIGMAGHGPVLLGRASERAGVYVWHVYADLGDHQLDRLQPERARVQASIEVAARIHTRFAGHPLLGEVRMHGKGLGIGFFEANLRDALRALEPCRPPEPYRAFYLRLLRRLHGLLDELPARAQAFREWGGPETLLHGDLWHTNIFAIPTAQGPHVRLIDWDLCGIGPACYDLSTFLLRFAPGHRRWILKAYADEAGRAGWRLPPERELNLLFETAECARYANRVIWPAIAVAQDHLAWGWEDLAEVNEWFEGLRPVLPLEPHTPASKVA